MSAGGQVMTSHAETIIAVSAVLSFLAICSVFARFYARKIKGNEIFIDDWLIVIGLILCLGVTVNNIVGAVVAGIGDNEIYIQNGTLAGFPTAAELLPQGKVMFAFQFLHLSAMPVIKGSILAFYWRIFPNRGFKIAVICITAYLVCWFISIFFATLFQCNPIWDNWGTVPSEMGGCISNIIIMYQVAAVTNMASDVIILCIPFPLVFKLHMPLRHKIAVLGIFLTGAIVVVAGIGRSVAFFQLQYNADADFSYDYYSLIVWSSVEPCLAVIGACLPTLRPLFSGMSPESVIGSIRSALSLSSMDKRNRADVEKGNNGSTPSVVGRGFVPKSKSSIIENQVTPGGSEEQVADGNIVVQKSFSRHEDSNT